MPSCRRVCLNVTGFCIGRPLLHQAPCSRRPVRSDTGLLSPERRTPPVQLGGVLGETRIFVARKPKRRILVIHHRPPAVNGLIIARRPNVLTPSIFGRARLLEAPLGVDEARRVAAAGPSRPAKLNEIVLSETYRADCGRSRRLVQGEMSAAHAREFRGHSNRLPHPCATWASDDTGRPRTVKGPL
jgi:hypothetical protein